MPSAPCVRPATMPSAAAPWASACSTTSPSRAAHALEQHGLERVAIVDFDVHHGNGTEDIFRDDPRVLMVRTFQHPFYPYCGTEEPAPTTWSTCRCRPAPAARRSARR